MTSSKSAVKLDRPARRIVSLAPSLTEILFFLGLESEIAGITEHCDIPQSTAGKKRIGPFSQPEMDRILEVEADLILGLDRFHSRFAGQFDEAGIPALYFYYRTVEDVFKSMEEILQAAGTVEEGISLINGLRDRVAAVQAALAGADKTRVFRMMTDDPFFTPSATCYQYDALRLAGAELMPLDFEEPYVPINIDEIIAFDPQLIISCGRQTEKETKQSCPGCRAVKKSCMRLVSQIAEQHKWRDTSAARNSQIHALTCGMLCRPGPRLVEGIEWLAQLFHPGLRLRKEKS